MCEHQFVYTVSGIELSEEQKARISESIAIAVTRAIAGDFPAPLPADFVSSHPACGGLDVNERAEGQESEDTFDQLSEHENSRADQGEEE